MQYGRYGLAFDDSERSPVRRYAWLLWLIPAVVLLVLLVRGCKGGEDKPPALAVEDPATAPRYDAPEQDKKSSSFLSNLFPEGEKKGNASVAAGEAGTSAGPQPVAQAAPAQSEVETLSPAVKKLLDSAMKKEREDDLLGARMVYWDLLGMKEAEGVHGFIERQLAGINHDLLYEDRPAPEKVEHTIVQGNLISRIASQYHNTQAYILSANKIANVSQLRIGRKIWVLNQPKFVVTVYKKQFSAVLTLNGHFYKRYSVGIGEAPEGTYTIRSSVKHPVYRRSGHRTIPYRGEGNILGTWYILLNPRDSNTGLHGTWDESTLGRTASAGKVRFSNSEIEELALLLPKGTKIIVKDE